MASPGATAAPSPTVFDNSSVWPFTSWTVQHLKDSVNNVTRFAPSIEDLILAGPRMLTKLGILSLPDAVDGFGQRVIADPTSSEYFIAATTTATEMLTQVSEAAANVVDVLENEDQDPAVLVSKFSSDGTKGLGSVFSYATSKWALCCVAMAIILNRTHIFAASRRRLFLTWPIRLFLRILPIIFFSYQARLLLQSIKCQTSPDFAELRWGNSSKTSDLMFAQPSTYLHGLSTVLLLGATDYDSCRAVQMVPPSTLDYSDELRGSLSLLWPLFGTLCASHFLETVSCAVQGRQVAVETGMTLFEHSLAFAEADAAISNQLGWGLFSSGGPSNVTYQHASGASIAISRSMIMRRVNTPPEVLLVAFLSAMSHITSHVLGVFNLQSKFRLVSTGFWAMCFMGSIVIEALDFSLDSPSNMGLFKFPTVCIIGFIPHVMVFCGTLICFSIYAVALFLSALQPPDRLGAAGRQLTFRERLALAHENMQANISLSDIRISREMDFYTALLRTGFGVITMASEAVYLNEDHDINLKNRTWLEDERLKELESLRMQWAGSGLGATRYDSVGTIGMIPIKDGQLGASSGYARERAAQKIPKTRMGEKRARDGVGASERSSRWLLALEFMLKINKLLLRWAALLFLKALSRIGVRIQPQLLLWLSGAQKKDKRDEAQPAGDRRPSLLGRNGRSGRFYNDETADVEAEVRRRLRRHPETANLPDSEIDSRLYSSWKFGDLWGSVDTSGDWEPDEGDDKWDTTSMIHSVIGDSDEQDQWVDESEYEDGDGQRTPTQASRQLSISRESTPFDQPFAMDDLARLLRPTSPEERREAHALAAHLMSDRIVTRSQYARMQQNQRGRLLLDPHGSNTRNKLSDEEEAELLEDLIITRRTEAARERRDRRNQNTTKANDEDDGRGGPQCVVCHSAPRKVIVWPCRCLSLCDECRVTLAMNNFDKCVCCRREVVSFSRIYVP
ncbi:uncharacterized protein GGS22DRAFT_4084 [Annulohypoxylon maeteangense]|uniref:uncharacterized protein n=1 Tax=Annulohypoxylon maeteangense TaxID=1927788 RepID=UPI0020074A0A|nr:uncharacterized protein GGS22DRAFT_4084 [Annulohypoxylon maeteangense]KAI0889788.1 hypothetical protein GGS22DRAFT_4084 [Annulohypoxylon maeteangense]